CCICCHHFPESEVWCTQCQSGNWVHWTSDSKSTAYSYNSLGIVLLHNPGCNIIVGLSQTPLKCYHLPGSLVRRVTRCPCITCWQIESLRDIWYQIAWCQTFLHCQSIDKGFDC